MVWNFDIDRTCDVAEKRDEKKKNWDANYIVTAIKVATSGVPCMERVVQRICESCSETAPTTIVEVAELAPESVEMKRKNETLTNQSTDMEAKLGKTPVAGGTKHLQLRAEEQELPSPKLHWLMLGRHSESWRVERLRQKPILKLSWSQWRTP